ncbi:response regulator [Rhizobium laguerreae]|uniref:response regulator n=1 Tax=Rhizobium laguerreae TaxID=1076926 RepID=UPI001C9112C3|nr:response regulator [Rhizobium laguerreae]MBY3048722.1 response regulator [Rhizobium laguerreae]
MSFPAPPLEGFIVVVQHRPDVARRIESALSQAGATVFTASTAAETIEVMNRYQSHLVVVDTHDADGVFNQDVVFAAFHRRSGRICYSETFPKDGLITWARWVDIKEPAAAVVEQAIEWRRGMRD